MEENKHYDLYVMAEAKYKDSHKDLNEEELFPFDWYSSEDYFTKNKILAEAMARNVLIKDTMKYQDFIEQVKTM